MGNSFSIANSLDCTGPDIESVRIFKSIHVNWLEGMVPSLKEVSRKGCVVMNDKEQMLSWKSYFQLFSSVQEKVSAASDVKKISQWHPATKNYLMTKVAIEYEAEVVEAPPEEDPAVDDDSVSEVSYDEAANHTDHEDDDEMNVEGENAEKLENSRPASSKGDNSQLVVRTGEFENGQVEEEKNDDKESDHDGESPRSGSSEDEPKTSRSEKSEEVKVEKVRKIKGWNSQCISPIFFGYNTATLEEQLQKQKEDEELKNMQEKRAVEKARSSRHTMIGAFEKSIKLAKAAREKHMDDLTAKYEVARKRREENLERAGKTMANPMQLALFKREWEMDNKAADQAYESEMVTLRRVHVLKTESDEVSLKKKLEELEVFKDSSLQEMPAAERLEEISRIEMNRLIDVVDSLSIQMDNVRKEYVDLKTDTEALIAKNNMPNTATKVSSEVQKKQALARNKEIQTMKSMINIAETQLKEKQKELFGALSDLNDAEVLLQRAIRIKQQQDQLLPLFRLLANERSPCAVRLDMFIAALTVLCSGTFDQKLQFLLSLIKDTWIDDSVESPARGLFSNIRIEEDSNEENAIVPFSALALSGCYSSKLICDIIEVFHSTLFHFNLVRDLPVRQEILNSVMRSFTSLRLSLSCDLSEFEMKQLFQKLFSKSLSLCNAFGFEVLDTMSTYQRMSMHPFALYNMSLIDRSSCQRMIHFESIKFKPQLSAARKLTIHEMAISMGKDDLYKTDYSRYLKQGTKKVKSIVPMLDHGHLGNVQFLLYNTQNSAALRIQSLARGVRQRQVAAETAKSQAFQEAKELAVQEMRDKIVREFRKRESNSGVVKIKWDAQVRMRQVKERTQGSNLSRSETVILMMEEAITRAREEIESRFKEIESKEKRPNKKTNDLVINNVSTELTVLEVCSLFGVQPPTIIKEIDANLKQDRENLEKVMTQMDQNRVDPTPSSDENGDPENEPTDGDADDKVDEESGTVDGNRLSQMLRGHYKQDLTKKGELVMETNLRLALYSPHHDIKAFYGRIRSLNKALTELKANGVMAENPSKRILMKMVTFVSKAKLAEELKNHYLVCRRQETIADHMLAIAKSDLEFGILNNQTDSLMKHVEKCVKLQVLQNMQITVSEIDVILQSRLKAAPIGTKEIVLIEAEVERSKSLLARFEEQVGEVQTNFVRLRERFKRLSKSHAELEHRQRCVHALKNRCESKAVDPEVFPHERRNWVIRLMFAERYQVRNDDDLRMRCAEIKSVGDEFCLTVQRDAEIIVSEYFLPRYEQSIPVVHEEDVDGRGLVCGRGVGGKTVVYEAHHILYRVCLDDHGIFSGCDEFAMKSAGNERLSSLEFLKCHSKSMNIPLIATIDLFGFRVLAVAKLPTEICTFTDEGEIRKVSEEMVQGLSNKGDKFLFQHGSSSAIALKAIAEKLNLADHYVKSLKGINPNLIPCSSELKVYRGHGSELYVKDFWRVMPSESPLMTKHLASDPRGQSVYWRQLRPEYVRACPKPLSADAFCLLVFDCSDRDEQIERIETATKELVDNIIPKFMEELSNRNYLFSVNQGLGLDLPVEMHSRGINIRHLGLMRSLLWHPLPGTVTVFHREKFIRTSKDLRHELLDGDMIQVNGVRFKVKETKGKKIGSSRVPIDGVLTMLSEHNICGYTGRIKSERHSLNLRSVLFGEMVARTVKNIIRLQLRQYAMKSRAVSSFVATELICFYLNVLSGSNEESCRIWEEVIYVAIKERFGEMAVTPSERSVMHILIAPVLIYVVKKLQTMLHIRFSSSCIGEFLERPEGFVFQVTDILEIKPVLKHNIPMLPYAEAQLIVCAARKAAASVYNTVVVNSKPLLFIPLRDRKGTRHATNIGTLGADYRGNYSANCELNQEGPIINDPLSYSVLFSAAKSCCLEIPKFHPGIIPQSVDSIFSLECFVLCQKSRVAELGAVITCGRYALIATRQGYWSFSMFEGVDEVHISVCPINYDAWVYFVIVYDASLLRIFVDSVLTVEMDISVPMQVVKDEFAADLAKRRKDIDVEESLAKGKIREEVQAEGFKFFTSRDGTTELKKLVTMYLEQQDYLMKAGAATDEIVFEDKATLKKRRADALDIVKAKYIDDLYTDRIRLVTERFQNMRSDVTDRERKHVDDGEIRMRKLLKIGAGTASVDSNELKNFFNGKISCLAMYDRVLTSDEIRLRYITSRTDKTRDSLRLYNTAACKFEESLLFTRDDLVTLEAYGKALCEYLKVELTVNTDLELSAAKNKIFFAIDEFIRLNVASGIGAILKELPREATYADIACKCFNSIMKVDKCYFTSGGFLNRRDLVNLNSEFALDSPDNPAYMVATAAAIFKEVVRDFSLCFAYGEMKLDWLVDLHCPELVVGLIKHSFEDSTLNVVVIGDIVKAYMKNSPKVTDADIEVLTTNLMGSVGFDFSVCPLLTNKSLLSLIKLKNLNILVLDGCIELTDDGLKSIEGFAEQLITLSVAGCVKLSDTIMEVLAEKCTTLKTLNVSNCPNISHISLILFTRNNRMLNRLSASGCYISDAGMAQMCNNFSRKSFSSLDVSFCRDITDHTIMTLAQACPNLEHLNLCGLSRITTDSMRSIISKCWQLKTLVCEDMFLLTDESFYFDKEGDGRPVAKEAYLHELTSLNLRDCVNISDEGIRALTERCRKMERFILRGCDKITDLCLKRMVEVNPLEGHSPFFDTIQHFDVSFCGKLTAPAILELLRSRNAIDTLSIAGIVSVTDEIVHDICRAVRTIIRFNVSRCSFLTDASLCSMADYLWLEELDLSSCFRITDEGIEVVTSACVAIEKINLMRLTRITSSALMCVGRNCKNIREVNISGCPKISELSIADFKQQRPICVVIR